MKFTRFIGLLLLATVAGSGWAEEFDFESGGVFHQEDTFLDVDEAFILSSTVVDDQIQLRWDVAEGYYLYRHQFDFKTIALF